MKLTEAIEKYGEKTIRNFLEGKSSSYEKELLEILSVGSNFKEEKTSFFPKPLYITKA